MTCLTDGNLHGLSEVTKVPRALIRGVGVLTLEGLNSQSGPHTFKVMLIRGIFFVKSKGK
jgi:hypothetical protein